LYSWQGLAVRVFNLLANYIVQKCLETSCRLYDNVFHCIRVSEL